MSIVIPAGTPFFSVNVQEGWNFNMHAETLVFSKGVQVVKFPHDLTLKSVSFFNYFPDGNAVVESTGNVFLSDHVLNDAEICDTAYVKSVIPAGTDLYAMQGDNSIVFSTYFNNFIDPPDFIYKTTEKLVILSEKPGSQYIKNYDGWKEGWFGERFVLKSHEKLRFSKNLRI